MRRFLKTWLRIVSRIYIFKYKPLIVAITGNTGKTSTKEAVGILLEKAFPDKIIRKAPKNLNTDIGVPLTILALKDARNNLKDWCINIIKSIIVLFYDKHPADYLILELAADRPGEIKYFTKFLKIDISIITSIGKDPVHLEFFKNRNELIAEKAWLAKGTKNKGVVLLNYDDIDVRKMAKFVNKNSQVIFYGKGKKADLKFIFKDYSLENNQIRLQSVVTYHHLRHNMTLNNVIGEGSLYALAAALLLGKQLNISFAKEVEILKKYYKTPPGRMRVLSGIKETIIIDDSYNASPLAFENAIETIKKINSIKFRKVAVLGDMAELGDKSEQIHRHIFQFAQEVFDIILCVGPETIKASQEFSCQDSKVYQAINSKLAKDKIKKILKRGDLILIKGAQATRTEKIVKTLLKDSSKAKDLLVRQEKYWLTS
jgi:UDP-N-acetylmuramoyl-tripeptide--D-alanyl-D-alanine ligase